MESYVTGSLYCSVSFLRKFAIRWTVAKLFDWKWSRSPLNETLCIFFIFQPKRVYYLEDHTGYAMEWVKKIEEVHRAYFGDTTQL